MATPVIAAILRWLRAGYPDGVPSTDYIPLVALLGRELTTEQVAQILEELHVNGALATDAPLSRADIGTAILKVKEDVPSEADVSRVATRLAEHGHPLEPDAQASVEE